MSKPLQDDTLLSEVYIDSVSQLDIKININYRQFNLTIQLPIPLKGITGIFGHSASGKSTLLRAIAGLEQTLDGEITLADKKLVDTKQGLYLKPEQRQVGLVFQNSRLFDHLTVLGNLEFAVKRCKHNKLSLDEVIKLTELTALLEYRVTELSGGQQQRVALARAILAEPKLLLLDEPLSALDQHSKAQLLRMMLTIQKKLNLPMLYVSHSLDELQQVCDTLIVMSKGKVIDFGNIHQVIHRLNSYGDADIMHQQTSLSLPIKQFDNGHGLTTLALSAKQDIFLLANEDFEQQTSLRCFILASDISISLTEASDSSIVNHICGTIQQISHQRNNALVTVHCNSQDFFVMISAFSLQKLSLTIKQQVCLQFKAGAVRTFIH